MEFWRGLVRSYVYVAGFTPTRTANRDMGRSEKEQTSKKGSEQEESVPVKSMLSSVISSFFLYYAHFLPKNCVFNTIAM